MTDSDGAIGTGAVEMNDVMNDAGLIGISQLPRCTNAKSDEGGHESCTPQ